MGAALTIFLVVIDTVFDIGGYSSHNRGMLELHRFSSKGMMGIMFIKVIMFVFLYNGYVKRKNLYLKDMKDIGQQTHITKFLRFFRHILALGTVYFFSLISSILFSFLLSYELHGVFIEVVRTGINLIGIFLLMKLLTNKKGDFRSISYIYQLIPGNQLAD